ncbi:MAG: hypothetical protein COB27_004590 [Moritella sp.]|uniref:hypothetical protein n=1 Tax=Moritella sp. TaxID=78556 RepID=UPI00216D4C28|nr:hypothetical protein [Moritella sp.]MBL1416138.1 hypothetical protein [Moritella sp.]
MKKLILATLIASTLAACGGSSDNESATPEPVPPTTPDVPMTPIEPSTLVIEPEYVSCYNA